MDRHRPWYGFGISPDNILNYLVCIANGLHPISITP